MYVTMFGSDYAYAFSPRDEIIGYDAGGVELVGPPAPLSLTVTQSSDASVFKSLLDKGYNFAMEWLKTRQQQAVTQSQKEEVAKQITMLQAGINPFTGTQISIVPVAIGIGAVAVGAIILAVIMSNRRKRG